MRNRLLICLAALTPTLASAQTTPTEIAAAADVLKQIAEEHAALQGLLGEYHQRLWEVYAPEVGVGSGAGR